MAAQLFTARKLSTTTKLNMANTKLMVNTEKGFALSSSIFAEQNASALKSTKASQDAYNTYEKAINKKGATDEEKKKAETELEKAQKKIDTQSQMSSAKIAKLNQQQSLLELEKKTLETQLQAYNNELSNVEKAEEDSIKKSAPGYVK